MMQNPGAIENNCSNNWINKDRGLYLFRNDDHKNIYPVLFLLLLFYHEAGKAFVENPLSRTVKINIKNPGQVGRDFCLNIPQRREELEVVPPLEVF
jgi:hypothetical protein